MLQDNFPTKVLWLGMNDAYDNLPFLKKYAPKYYSKVDFEIADFQNHQILSKTRFIKIVRSAKLQDDIYLGKEGLVLKALGNKSKFIQKFKDPDLDLHYYFPYLQHFSLSLENLSSWKAFLSFKCLKSLTVESSALELETAKTSKALGLLKWRFWIHLPEMKNLRHLSLNFYSSITCSNYQFLQKLATFQKFLSSLKSLTLNLNSLEDTTSQLFNLDQLYQHVTVLRANELSSGVFTRFLGNIQNYKNLRELSILQAMIMHRDESLLPFFVCLKDLQSLSQLTSLELCFDFSDSQCFTLFLQNFSLPGSIKNIRLSFQELHLDDPQATISSESFLQFCQKWENLSNINSLHFTFLDSSNLDTLSELNLTLSVFKAISKLTSLYYSSSNDLGMKNPKNHINFQFFWDSIQHLQPTLETLYLESCFISIKEIQNIQALSSCALKTLSLCGKIIGENQMLNLFKLFSSDPSRESQLFLEGVSPISKENLTSLLKDLHSIPRNIRTCMNINLIKIAAKDMIAVLCNNDDQILKVRNKENIRLNFSNTPKLKQSGLDQIMKMFEEAGLVCCLRISDQKGDVLFSGDNWDKILS